MSEERLHLVRAAIAAFNAYDVDALAAMCTDDFEFVSVLTAVDGASTYSGPSAWRDYFAVIEQMWQDWHVEDLRVFAEGERAAAIFRIVGTAKQSGVRIGQGVGITYEFRVGKFSRMESYVDPPDALTAIGLSKTEL